MAIENTLAEANEQLLNTSEQEQTLLNQDSSKLDFSTSTEPTGDFSGLNLEQVQEPNEPAGDGSFVTTDQTTKPVTLEDLSNQYKKQRDISKNWSRNAVKVAATRRDPRLAFGDYEFDQYTTNVDRYRGYGKETFNRLGFNPLDDNEKYYNENTSNWQDFKRMTGQFGTLFGSAFSSNYRSIGNFLSNDQDVLSPDLDGAATFEKAMKIGMSSKKGVRAWGTNFALNTAYTAGIMANIAFEEGLIWAGGLALSPFTGGASVAAATELGGASLTRGALALKRARELKQAVSSAYGGAQIGGMAKGGFQMIKSLKDINNARAFWTGAKTGAKTFAKGTAGFLNPLRQTTEAIQGMRAGFSVETGYRNLSNFAKMSRGFGGFYRDTRENIFALSESQLEGGNTYNDVLNEKIDKYKKENGGKYPEGADLNQIYTDAEAASRLTTSINIPLIYLSNRFVFDGLFNFKGVKPLIEAAEDASTKGLAKGLKFDLASKSFTENAQGFFKEAFQNVKRPKALVGSFLKYTQANLAEGLQEIGQEVTGGAVKKYYMGNYKDASLGGKDYLTSAIQSSLNENVFSAQGLDIFLSGFLMGGATQGGIKLLKNTVTGSRNLFLESKIAPNKWKEQYKTYKEQKKQAKDVVRNAMNEIVSDPEKFFSRRNESLVTQKKANQDMIDADLSNDSKLFYDAKDEKTLDHIFTVIEAGGIPQLKAAFTDLRSLSDNELKEAYNIDNGVKAREKLDEYVTRMDQIQKSYNFFNSKFSNPFNPSKLRTKPSKDLVIADNYLSGKITSEEFLSKTKSMLPEGADAETFATEEANKIIDSKSGHEAYIKEFIAYKAFEDAKKAAIGATFGYERAVERMVGLFENLISEAPLSKANALDFTVLQSEKSMRDEVKMLSEEINTLEEGGSKEQKALAKSKKEKLNALQNYIKALSEYKKNKTNPSVDENGQITISFNEENAKGLKDAYNAYLKAIAKVNDDYVFDSKIDDSFDKLLDYYELDADSRRFNNVVNTLSNPEGLLRYADLVNSTLTDLYLERFDIMEKRVDDYMSIFEFQMLINVLGEMNVKINPADVEDLLKRGIIPNTFFDLKNNRLITESDRRYPQIVQMINNFASLQEGKEADEIEEEQSVEQPTEEETTAPAAPFEMVERIEEKPEEKVELPVDLQLKLKAAYNEYIRFNPDATMTFKEYVDTSSKAQRIKEEYEKQQVKPAAETVIEVKAPEIEVVEEPVAEPEVTPTEETPVVIDAKADIQQKIIALVNARKSDSVVAKAIRDFNQGKITIEELDAVQKKWDDENGLTGLQNQLSALEGEVKPIEVEPVQVQKEDVSKILDGITSLRDMPNISLNDKSAVSNKLLDMITNKEIDSITLTNMLKEKMEQLRKNLTVSDFVKGDFVTFTNGRKGWITSITKTGDVQMKMVGSEKGQYEIMDVKDISKNVSMIEKSKKVSTQPVEELTIDPADLEEIEGSKKDTRESYSSDINKIKESTNSAKESSKDGVNNNLNNLLNNLGCKTKGQ